MIILLLLLTLSQSILVPCSPAIHVVGMAGHGKSTIVKTLTEDNNVTTGNIETTEETNMYYSKYLSMYIYDYPGFGTPRYPIHYWINKYKHVLTGKCSNIVLVIGNRIYEQHRIFYNFIKRFKKISIIRSQMDIFRINPRIFKGYLKDNLKIKGEINIMYYNKSHPRPFLKTIKGFI